MKKTLFILILPIIFFSAGKVLAQQNVEIPLQEALVAQEVQLDLGRIVSATINVLISLGVIALLFWFVRGAYLWLTAGGDKGQVEEARSTITNGLIGLALLASVYAVYTLVDQFFGIGLTTSDEQSPAEVVDCSPPNPACSCGSSGRTCTQFCFANGVCGPI